MIIKVLKTGYHPEIRDQNSLKEGFTLNEDICEIFTITITIREMNTSTDHHYQKISQTYAQNNHRKLQGTL